jgi:hypothetical protein
MVAGLEEREDAVVLDDDRPGVALASLPASLIVSGLVDQLARARSGYTPTDYLAPILSVVALLRERHRGDADVTDEIRSRLADILGAVVAAVADDWGADPFQLGLDPEGGDYAQNVAELYRFFVVDRMRNCRDLLFRCVVADRKRIADRYRRGVEKRNQTVAEARKVFQSFDDVVVWGAMPAVVAAFRDGATWSFGLQEVLARLGGGDPGSPGAGYLAAASQAWTSADFASRYVAPALMEGEPATLTALGLGDRWLSEAPKKTEE